MIREIRDFQKKILSEFEYFIFLKIATRANLNI